MMAALPVCLLAACQQKEQSNQQVKADTVKLTAVRPVFSVMCGVPLASPAGPIIFKQLPAGQLKGRWSSLEDWTHNVAFIIDGKTIYFPDSYVRHPYRTQTDSLYIVYSETYTMPLGYSFNGPDTLRLWSKQGPAYYTRLKK